jgi:membrane protein
MVNISNFFGVIVDFLENTLKSGNKFRTGMFRFIIRLFKEFKKDQCLIRASSLSYTSLLALIPLTALSFSLFTAFDTFQGIKDIVQRSLVNLLIPTRQDEILIYIDQFLENSKTMGIIGLLLFTITSIMLLNRISESFNSIWGSKNRKNFVGKFTSYTAVIVFGTLFIGTSFTITAPIKAFLTGFPEIQFLIRWLFVLSPSIFIFITFLMMITAIPEGKVNLKSSMIGAFVGTILWGFARAAFTEGASYVIRMSKLYGSMAVIPIFLFWLYLIWIIIFLALEISYIHQHAAGLENKDQKRNHDPGESIKLGFSVFIIIAKHFDTGITYTSTSEISENLQISEDTVNGFIRNFSSSGLIYETDETIRKLFPSKSLNKISIKDVLVSILGSDISIDIDETVSQTIKTFLNEGYAKIGATSIEDFLQQT